MSFENYVVGLVLESVEFYLYVELASCIQLDLESVIRERVIELNAWKYRH